VTADEWEKGAEDLEALRQMIEGGEPAIDSRWTCGSASLRAGSLVDLKVGKQTRLLSSPRGMHKRPEMLRAWCCLALAAETRLCRARAVLARTFNDLIEEEASR
jgi:hypothetical protein